jgi:hypothetical protein
MQCSIASLASRVHAKSLFRSEQGGDWRKLIAGLSSMRHDPPPAV